MILPKFNFSLWLTRNFNEIIIQRIMKLDKKKRYLVNIVCCLIANCDLILTWKNIRSIKWMNILSKFSKKNFEKIECFEIWNKKNFEGKTKLSVWKNNICQRKQNFNDLHNYAVNRLLLFGIIKHRLETCLIAKHVEHFCKLCNRCNIIIESWKQ